VQSDKILEKQTALEGHKQLQINLYGSSLGLYQQTWGVNREGGCENKEASHIDIVTVCEPPETLAGGIVNMATDK
jgi:hypothetical protein